MSKTPDPIPPVTATLPFWRQLRWNLLLYFIILATMPLMVVQYLTLAQERKQATDQIINQLESVAQNKQNQLDQWLDASDSMLDILSSGLNPTAIRTILANAASSGYAQAQINTALANAAVSRSEGETNQFRELFVYNADGRIVASSDERQIGKVVTRQPYFASSLEENYTSPPYYEVGTGVLTMMTTLPLENNEGEVTGVLAGRLDLATLANVMLARVGLGESGETYLVSLESHFLVTPSHFDDYSLTRAYHSEGIDAALNGESGVGIYENYERTPQRVIGVYQWNPRLQVALLAEIREAEALTTYTLSLNSSIALTLLAAALAAVSGFFVISQISRPLTKLTQIAVAIGSGDLNLRANIRQRSEIGLLASSFNQMTQRLVQNIGELDTRLRELDETNQALREATAEAEEASRLKDEFLAVMSHELRTPLNSIIGYTGILQMGGGLVERHIHMVNRIRANSERLLSLINDILDISRIESGRMEIAPAPLRLRELIEKLQNQMGVLAEQKSLTLEVTVDEAIPEVIQADEDLITKITTNLLSNAFKFTEKGKVSLAVKKQTNNLIFEVTDTGVGIPAHMHEVIFERFRQVDGSSKRAYGGTGLGLAIVHHLCSAMSGSVRVRSTVGVGSTFIVTLPLLEDNPQKVEAAHVI